MESIKNRQALQSPASRSKLFHECIIKSWWAILFFLICYFAYTEAVCYKKNEEKILYEKLHTLKIEKKRLLDTQKDLKLQIASQQDERFIELVLMRKLGLVPEGQTKVHFIN